MATTTMADARLFKTREWKISSYVLIWELGIDRYLAAGVWKSWVPLWPLLQFLHGMTVTQLFHLLT